MKQTKKLVLMALGLAVMAVLALAGPAWAAGDASITIHRDSSYSNVGTDAGTTYRIYKVFDASYDANSGTNAAATPGTITNTAESASYTIEAGSPWVDVLGSFSGDAWTSAAGQDWVTLSKTIDAGVYQVNPQDLDDASDVAAFASWLLAHKDDIAPTDSKTARNGSNIVFSGLDRGYYLVDSTVGSNLVMATTDLDIYEKNSYPDVVKTTATAADRSVQIGDVVNYLLTITVPAGADKPIVLTDTMSAGLTFKAIDSVTPYTNGVAGTAYTSAASSEANGNAEYYVSGVTSNTSNGITFRSFTITIPENTVKSLAGTAGEHEIVVRYSAYVNRDAVVQYDDGKENTNYAYLTYGNYTTRPSGNSQQEDASITTQRIRVLKYDSADLGMTPMAGAVFELRLADGVTVVKLVKVSDSIYRVADQTETGTAVSHAGGGSQINSVTAGTALVSDFVTISGLGGEIVINGLDADNVYQLVEIQAPAGYNLLQSATSIQPSTSSVAVASIQNAQGTILPSTGGMGTALLNLVGGAFVVTAIMLLLTRQRIGRRR